MSEVHFNFIVRKEIDEKFKEIMEYFDTDNRTEAFMRMTNSFMELVWKAQRYDWVKEDIFAHETVRKLKKGQ